MNIGSAWTRKNEDNQVTGISIVLDEAITCLFPQLKEVRFTLKAVPKEQREHENSPGWRLSIYKPQEKTQNAVNPAEGEEIPF